MRDTYVCEYLYPDVYSVYSSVSVIYKNGQRKGEKERDRERVRVREKSAGQF